MSEQTKILKATVDSLIPQKFLTNYRQLVFIELNSSQTILEFISVENRTFVLGRLISQMQAVNLNEEAEVEHVLNCLAKTGRMSDKFPVSNRSILKKPSVRIEKKTELCNILTFMNNSLQSHINPLNASGSRLQVIIFIGSFRSCHLAIVGPD